MKPNLGTSITSLFGPRAVPAREEISMADHPIISTESGLTSPALPTTAVTRRSLLGGAGIAVSTAVLASPPSMPGITQAAAQPVSVAIGGAQLGKGNITKQGLPIYLDRLAAALLQAFWTVR